MPKMLLFCRHKKHSFLAHRESLINTRHLKFIFKISNRSEAAENCRGFARRKIGQ